jgi:hypothetical protein
MGRHGRDAGDVPPDIDSEAGTQNRLLKMKNGARYIFSSEKMYLAPFFLLWNFSGTPAQ